MDFGAWLSALPVVVVAAAVLVVPGLVATAPLRLSLLSRAAMSGLIGTAAIGLAGVVFGALHVPWAAWQPVVIAVPIGVVAAFARNRVTREEPGSGDIRGGWIVLSWSASVIAVCTIAFAMMPTPDRPSQTYDNVFHLSGIAHVLQTGDASSLTLRGMIETDRSWAPYSSAWHSLGAAVVQLSGASLPMASTAAWIAVFSVVWLPGVAWLTRLALAGHIRRDVAVIVAMPLGAVFAAMPYSLLVWGSLYPTYFATAVLPAAVGMAVWFLRILRRTAMRQSVVWFGLGGTILGVVAVASAQARVLASWFVIVAPIVVVALVRAYRAAHAAGGPARRRAQMFAGALGLCVVVVVVGLFVYAVAVLDLFGRPLGDRLGGPQAQATQTVWAGIVQVLLQAMPIGVDGLIAPPAFLLAAAVLGGLVLAIRTRGLGWLVVAYLVFSILYVLSAGSDDVFAKLATALWYKDRFRLSSVLPMLAVPLATFAIVRLSALLPLRGPRRTHAVAALASFVVAATSAVSLVGGGVTASVAHVFRLPESAATDEVVSAAQIAFFEQIDDVVPSDQRVLGDPWDGSAWTWVFGEREPVFPHVNGQWDLNRQKLAWNLPDIETDPTVCIALDALRVRYVLYDPHALGGGDPAGNHFPGPHAAVEAGLFAPVASSGTTVLYRIDQCGPLDAKTG